MSEAPTVLIYHPEEAGAYARALADRGFAGRLLPCADQSAVARSIGAAEVIIAGPFPWPELAKAERLRWVQSLWAGVEHWLAALPPGVALTRMVGVFGRPMAEYVLGHLLAIELGLARLYTQQQERRWQAFQAGTLAGKVMGIAGVGDIGAAIARRARAWDLSVWGLTRSGRPLPECDRSFGPAELDTFLGGLDYLVLVLPDAPGTRGLIGAAQLQRLRRAAVLVNVGRGSVVAEDAVAAALAGGRLRAAVLDVFHREPLPADSPLWAAPGAVITPHIAALTRFEDAFAVVWDNLQRYQAGLPLSGLVDPSRGY